MWVTFEAQMSEVTLNWTIYMNMENLKQRRLARELKNTSICAWNGDRLFILGFCREYKETCLLVVRFQRCWT
jgi:hypothetical protein